jgi:Outer membrane protein beta-barrel domain
MKSLKSRSILMAALGFLILVLSVQPSFAAPVDGDSEIQVSGGAFHAQGSNSGAFTADIAYGYYLTPGWELGLRQALNYNFVHHGPDSWLATTTPFILYNFRITDILVPYLGISGGAVWNDRDATGTFGPNAGLKLFVADQAFINLGYRYEWFFDNFEQAKDNRTHGNHVANIGLGFVWGGSGRTAKPRP